MEFLFIYINYAPLHVAAINGNDNMVEFLISQKGFDYNLTDVQ